MKLKYTKRECTWAEYKIKVPNKCTVKDFLDKLYLSQVGWDVFVNSKPVSLGCLLRENDDIVLLQKEIGK